MANKGRSGTNSKATPRKISHEKRLRGRLKQDEKDTRRADVAKLRCQGFTVYEIAEKLGWGVTTINRDPQALRDAHRKAAAVDFGEMMSDQFGQLVALRGEAWKAWNLSLLGAKRPAGNPAWIRAILQINENDSSGQRSLSTDWCLQTTRPRFLSRRREKLNIVFSSSRSRAVGVEKIRRGTETESKPG